MSYAEEAKEAVFAFQEAFNMVDISGMADACNFPHVRLALGKFTTFKTRDDFMEALAGLKERLEAEGWAHTHMESIEVVHEGQDKVHFAIAQRRRQADGTVYKPFNTFWIITLQDGHWGIQFRSSYLA